MQKFNLSGLNPRVIEKKKVAIDIDYTEADRLSNEIFNIKHFTWLTFWEQQHIVNRYNLQISPTK